MPLTSFLLSCLLKWIINFRVVWWPCSLGKKKTQTTQTNLQSWPTNVHYAEGIFVGFSILVLGTAPCRDSRVKGGKESSEIKEKTSHKVEGDPRKGKGKIISHYQQEQRESKRSFLWMRPDPSPSHYYIWLQNEGRWSFWFLTTRGRRRSKWYVICSGPKPICCNLTLESFSFYFVYVVSSNTTTVQRTSLLDGEMWR